MTIEVKKLRSKKQNNKKKVHHATDDDDDYSSSHSYEHGDDDDEDDDEEETNTEPSAARSMNDESYASQDINAATNNNDDDDDDDDNDNIIPPAPSATTTNYESFPRGDAYNDNSLNNSLLDNSTTADASFEKGSSPSINSSSVKQNQTNRGQVLVHYHPQLGDEGYESTLLLDTTTQSSMDKYSRVTRAINTATRRDNNRGVGGDYTDNSSGPPKHIYPKSRNTNNNRGMHTRAIDDVREEKYSHHHHSPSMKHRSRNQMASDPTVTTHTVLGGNDEYNNAHTRQLRRRVFRVAMERGLHDERRKKMLDADADVGGPSLSRTTNSKKRGESKMYDYNKLVSGGSGSYVVGSSDVKSSGGAANGYASRYNNKSSIGGGDSSYTSSKYDEGDMPLTPGPPSKLPTTPKTPFSNGTSSSLGSTSIPPSPVFSPASQPPPSPPSQPPSYKTLVYNLIASNEPEKLVQIDRVMEKYKGREEELIKKLDLRYRRRRMKYNAASAAGSAAGSGGGGGGASKDGGSTKDGASTKGGETSSIAQHSAHNKDTPSASGLQQPLLMNNTIETKGSYESTSDNRPMMEIKTEQMKGPTKLTFIKVETPPMTPRKKDKEAIMTMQSWDKSDGGGHSEEENEKGEKTEEEDAAEEEDEDELMMPPTISKRSLPPVISNSTRAEIHSNTVQLGSGEKSSSARGAMSSSTMIALDEEDDNSGMIPLGGPKVSTATSNTTTAVVAANVKNLGNQVVNERLMREREERGKVKETLIAHVASTSSPVASPSPVPPPPPTSMSPTKLETVEDDQQQPSPPSSSPKLYYNDYKLKQTNSYGDGISVITMETKSTWQQNRGAQHETRVDENGEAVYSFDEMMKRPPNSITVESAGSGSQQQQQQHRQQDGEDGTPSLAERQSSAPAKLQRAMPDVPLPSSEEKAQAEKTSLETLAKLDNVEARIRARHMLREEEAKNKAQLDEEGDTNEEEPGKLLTKSAEDDLSEMESMFQDTKIKRAPKDATDTEDYIGEVEEGEGHTATNEDEKVEGEDVASPYVIESILSSFDEDDKEKPREGGEDEEPGQIGSANNANEAQTSTVKDTSNKEDGSTKSHQSMAEDAIAAAAIPATSTDASSAISNEEQHLEEEVARLIAEKESRLQAEKAVALMKAQRELEEERRARFEAEAARIKAEEELQRLKLEKTAAKEVVVANNESMQAEEKEEVPSQLDQARIEQEQQRLKLEQMALEAGSARAKAEKDLEKLRLERSASEAARLKTQEDLEQLKLDDGKKDEEDATKPPLPPQVIDQARLEAEAARIKAEEQLAKLKADRAAAMATNNTDLERENSQREDEIEKFRQGYQDDEDSDNDDAQLKPSQSVLSMPDDETAGRGELRPNETVETSETPKVEINDLDGDKVDDKETLETTVEPQDKSGSTSSSSPELEEPPTISRSPEREIEEAIGQESPSAEKDEAKIDTTTVLVPLSPSESEPTEVPATQVEGEGEVEAQIHHVARVTFEGDRSKGQLSFITGSKIEAHSNQRGPWWLGRCGGRTGWFPASAVVPASEFLAGVNSPSSNVVDQDESEELAKELSGDELNKVYDLIRNPSDDPMDEDGGESDEDSGSPAKNRWLDGGAAKSPESRGDSPPPDRYDPSEMAGLSERLYESHDEDSRSNQNEGKASTPISTPTEKAESITEVEETLSKDEPAKAQSANIEADVSQPKKLVESTKGAGNVTAKSQPQPAASKPKPEWRAAKDPKSGLIYYYHTGTREVSMNG